MAELNIDAQEAALKQRIDFLLRSLGSMSLKAFEKGPQFFKQARQESQEVGMFVMKRKPEINESAVRADFRARASVPLDEDGLILLTDSGTVPSASIRTFLTPTSIGASQRQVYDWDISADGVSGGLVLDKDELIIGVSDDEVEGLLETAYGNETYLEIAEGTPSEELLRSEVYALLTRQLETATYLGNLVGRYLRVTEFSDIY